MQERGFLQNISEPEVLDARLVKENVTAYIGFDATAPSLHVGSLLPIMMLRWWQKYGHRSVVLMGGGTTMVGDPSGRDTTRKILTQQIIQENLGEQKKLFERFLIFDPKEQQGCFRNNADWLCRLNFLDFMREIGQHFSISRMLSFDSVKLRLEREQHLSLLEFNYMVLQAYDFLMLARDDNCIVQMGGSDQWGNIVNGIDLARRIDGKQLFAVTSHLLTKADGSKMGKTATGAVWLHEDKLSSYDYWQYWRNTMDEDVGRFLRLFTELPLDEIVRYEALAGAELNEAKIVLAHEATKLCHGVQAADAARATAADVFGGGNSGSGKELPSLSFTEKDLAQGVGMLGVLQDFGWAQSKSAARRLVQQGGVRLRGEKLLDQDYLLSTTDFSTSKSVQIQAGKKNHGVIELREDKG